MAVVRPGSSADVAQIVQLSAAAGVAVVPRGGGASYTDGYAPAERESILIDTSRMNRILELNERDGYVVVEVGVTWATLNETLAAKGLRTPFFGPFSGLAATVGGSLSQNSVTWGTGVFGVSGETTLCVEVVLGDGRIVRTGSWGAANGVPFMRSLATREAGSEISQALPDVIAACRATGFDLVIIETSGIGQGDAAIVPHVDLSLYVMTPEFGAASQLEKIDMLDFADAVAINKFDRKGAQDALRDVAKQVQRNREAWTQTPEQMPVFGTQASRFNDDGVSAFTTRHDVIACAARHIV